MAERLHVSKRERTNLVRRSDALEDPYAEVLAAVDDSPVRGADETRFSQAGQTQWLSVVTAQRAALFQIADRRDRDAAKALLGETPRGVIVSDRYAVYRFIDGANCVWRTSCANSPRSQSAAARQGAWAQRELTAVLETLNESGRDDADLATLRGDLDLVSWTCFALATVPAGPDEAWRTATFKFYELRECAQTVGGRWIDRNRDFNDKLVVTCRGRSGPGSCQEAR